MKKHCYVLLTNTDTSFSRMLRAVTGYSFTHSSFSLEDPTQLLYSFARLHKDFPLPAGFVRETPGHGTMGLSLIHIYMHPLLVKIRPDQRHKVFQTVPAGKGGRMEFHVEQRAVGCNGMI